MKPILIAIIALVVIGIVGGGIYMSTRPKTDGEMISPTSQQAVQPTAQPTSAKMAAGSTSEFSGKLTDLLSRADSQKCVLQSPTGVEATGTFYLSSGKVRGENLNMQDTLLVNIVIKDNQMYFWTHEPTPYGFKMSFAQLESAVPSPSAGSGIANQYQDVLTTDQTFECSAWALDESKFTLPTNITFNSISR